MSSTNPEAEKSTVEKRAEWESFSFQVPDHGQVVVRNHSHEEPSEHEYQVRVLEGATVKCECPADTFHESKCKHRIAVEGEPAVMRAAMGGG